MILNVTVSIVQQFYCVMCGGENDYITCIVSIVRTQKAHRANFVASKVSLPDLWAGTPCTYCVHINNYCTNYRSLTKKGPWAVHLT